MKSFILVKWIWGTLQNCCLAIIDELEKQLFTKNLFKWANKKCKKFKNVKNTWKILSFFTCDHMYSSWDIGCDRQSFLSFWVIFCPFTPLIICKIKILKKWKKRLEISSVSTHVPQMTIICKGPEIWSATDNNVKSYNVWFLRYGVRQTEFFLILDHFLSFYLS